MTTYGADSFVGRVASTVQGATDTTFYILAVYFGSVGIKKTRHALVCGLFADLVGVVAAICMAYLFFH
jgi:spore maturation protein SpmB